MVTTLQVIETPIAIVTVISVMKGITSGKINVQKFLNKNAVENKGGGYSN